MELIWAKSHPPLTFIFKSLRHAADLFLFLFEISRAQEVGGGVMRGHWWLATSTCNRSSFWGPWGSPGGPWGGPRARGRSQGCPRGVPGGAQGGSGGLSENGHFLFFRRWILHTSNEILMFSIWGRFMNRSAAAQVLLFFDDFSRHVICKSMRWKHWKSLCILILFHFACWRFLKKMMMENWLLGGEFWGLCGAILKVNPMVFWWFWFAKNWCFLAQCSLATISWEIKNERFSLYI